MELNHLHVRGEYRGQGVRSAVIAAAEARAGHAGRPQMVSVAEDNPDHGSVGRLGRTRTPGSRAPAR